MPPTGIPVRCASTRGGFSGSRRWTEVQAVRHAGEGIEIVGVDGNALIAPQRAFADAPARAAFLHAPPSCTRRLPGTPPRRPDYAARGSVKWNAAP